MGLLAQLCGREIVIFRLVRQELQFHALNLVAFRVLSYLHYYVVYFLLFLTSFNKAADKC